MGRQAPTVYIVDSDAETRNSVGCVLGAAGYLTRSVASGVEFMNTHDCDLTGCVVLDLVRVGQSGLAIQSALKASGCRRPILFMTACADVPLVVAAMRAGAVDVLTKPIEPTVLLAAVEEAVGLDVEERARARARHSLMMRLASLTPREREVLDHVISGRRNKQIAGDLGTVEKTIKVHRARVMRKLGTRSLAELISVTSLAYRSSPQGPLGVTLTHSVAVVRRLQY